MRLAERTRQIKPSLTLAVDTKAKAMMKDGQDIVSFGVGEPDFDTPEHIKEAAIQAIREGFTKYTPVSGIDGLREAVAFRFKEDLGLDYGVKEVVISCGENMSFIILPRPYGAQGMTLSCRPLFGFPIPR